MTSCDLSSKGGIGYEIFIPISTYYRVPAAGTRIELEVRQVVRDDAITLYGFATAAEKTAFDLLIRIQHVGPKLALAVLSVLAPHDLASAIAHNDVARIDAAPGVGAKVESCRHGGCRENCKAHAMMGVRVVSVTHLNSVTATVLEKPSLSGSISRNEILLFPRHFLFRCAPMKIRSVA